MFVGKKTFREGSAIERGASSSLKVCSVVIFSIWDTFCTSAAVLCRGTGRNQRFWNSSRLEGMHYRGGRKSTNTKTIDLGDRPYKLASRLSKSLSWKFIMSNRSKIGGLDMSTAHAVPLLRWYVVPLMVFATAHKQMNHRKGDTQAWAPENDRNFFFFLPRPCAVHQRRRFTNNKEHWSWWSCTER